MWEVNYRQPVYDAGYKWVDVDIRPDWYRPDAEIPPTRVLVRSDFGAGRSDFAAWDPTGRTLLEHQHWHPDPEVPVHMKTLSGPDASRLYLKFSNLGDDEGKMLDFANRYGYLGLSFLSVLLPGESYPMLTYAELLGDWRNEVNNMRFAVKLWTAYCRSDESALAEWVKWSKSGKRVYLVEDFGPGVGGRYGRHLLASSAYNKQVFAKLAVGDVVDAAPLAVVYLINRAIADSTRSRLDFGRYPALSYTSVPETLLAAMWLQFAREVLEGGRVHECEICGMPVAGKRSRRFCSDSCRQRNHRRKSAT
jgi:hypothetical protein